MEQQKESFAEGKKGANKFNTESNPFEYEILLGIYQEIKKNSRYTSQNWKEITDQD